MPNDTAPDVREVIAERLYEWAEPDPWMPWDVFRSSEEEASPFYEQADAVLTALAGLAGARFEVMIKNHEGIVFAWIKHMVEVGDADSAPMAESRAIVQESQDVLASRNTLLALHAATRPVIDDAAGTIHEVRYFGYQEPEICYVWGRYRNRETAQVVADAISCLDGEVRSYAFDDDTDVKPGDQLWLVQEGNLIEPYDDEMSHAELFFIEYGYDHPIGTGFVRQRNGTIDGFVFAASREEALAKVAEFEAAFGGGEEVAES